jgi:hypothetical protein
MSWTESCTLRISESVHERSSTLTYSVEWTLWSPAVKDSHRVIGFAPKGLTADYQLAEAEADFEMVTFRLTGNRFRMYNESDWAPLPKLHDWRFRDRYFDRTHDGAPPAPAYDQEKYVGHVPPERFYAGTGLDPLPPGWSGPYRQATSRGRVPS